MVQWLPGGIRGSLARLWRRRPRNAEPSPLFDVDWYVSEHPDAQSYTGGAWAHYQEVGRMIGMRPNEFLDPAWYRERYPDVAAAGLDPMEHYLRWGGREGRDPGPRFSTTEYLNALPPGELPGDGPAANPLVHLLRHGGEHGDSSSPGNSPPRIWPDTDSPPASRLGLDTQSETGEGADGGDVRLIALYVPRFYPDPGKSAPSGLGPSDWRLVAEARPLFEGHYQPHVPADLGFYDLRLAESRREQADLATAYGISGFCYLHYWGDGKRRHERPFEDVLRSGDPDRAFCLTWVNTATRDHAATAHSQNPPDNPDDDRELIHSVLPALGDHRAITVDGDPMLIITSRLALARRTTEYWREAAHRAGLSGLYLVAMHGHEDLASTSPVDTGFDATVGVQPRPAWLRSNLRDHAARLPHARPNGPLVFDDRLLRAAIEEDRVASQHDFEMVFPGWDETASGDGAGAIIVHHSDPQAYKSQLVDAIVRARGKPTQHRFVFINAWNDWANGSHLEPDLRHGRAFLEATKQALRDAGQSPVLNPRS